MDNVNYANDTLISRRMSALNLGVEIERSFQKKASVKYAKIIQYLHLISLLVDNLYVNNYKEF